MNQILEYPMKIDRIKNRDNIKTLGDWIGLVSFTDAVFRLRNSIPYILVLLLLIPQILLPLLEPSSYLLPHYFILVYHHPLPGYRCHYHFLLLILPTHFILCALFPLNVFFIIFLWLLESSQFDWKWERMIKSSLKGRLECQDCDIF